MRRRGERGGARRESPQTGNKHLERSLSHGCAASARSGTGGLASGVSLLWGRPAAAHSGATTRTPAATGRGYRRIGRRKAAGGWRRCKKALPGLWGDSSLAHMPIHRSTGRLSGSSKRIRVRVGTTCATECTFPCVRRNLHTLTRILNRPLNRGTYSDTLTRSASSLCLPQRHSSIEDPPLIPEAPYRYRGRSSLPAPVFGSSRKGTDPDSETATHPSCHRRMVRVEPGASRPRLAGVKPALPEEGARSRLLSAHRSRSSAPEGSNS